MRDDLDHTAFEGVVTDAAGALIAGASITAHPVGTGQTRSTISSAEGRYRLIRLNPGVYNIQADAPGFHSSRYDGLNGIAGTTIRRDFQLSPSPVEAQVTVDSANANRGIDTSRTVVGGALDRRQIDELPVAERNVFELLFTLPGIIEPAFHTTQLAEGDSADRFQAAPEEAGIFALNGGTPFSNNLTIEGLDNNDDRSARERFIPSIDAVEEVQVIANQFSAEYGRASGGRVNLRLRSGSARLHGRGLYHFRDSQLNANSFHRNADPGRGFRLPFSEHTPGANLGGPLIVNRAFFFAAYEYGYVSDHTEIAALLPVDRNPAFPLPQPNGSNLGNTGVDRQGRPVTLNGGAQIGLYDVPVTTPKTAGTLQTRIDLTIPSRHSLFALVTIARNRDERGFPGGRRTLETLRGSGRNSSSIALSDSFVISERAISETRVQISRLRPADTPPVSQPVLLIEIDDPREIPGAQNPFSRSGTLLAGSSNLGGTDRREDRLQFQETLTLIRGRHQLRAGVDAQLINSHYLDLEDSTGTFYFNSPADFLTGSQARYRHRFNTSSELHNLYAGLFFQHDWRLRHNLTVSGGLRWDRETVLKDENNFGPRLALAWDPMADGAMVIRAGFGLFYNRALLRTLDDFTLTRNTILVDTNLPTSQRLLHDLQFPHVLDSTDPRIVEMGIRETGFVRRLETGFRLPESYQASVGFERAIGSGSKVEIHYVFGRGAHLWREVNANAPRLPLGFKSFSEYLLSRDFDNRRDAQSGERPISSTGNADTVRFDLSQTSSRVIEEKARRIVVFGLENQSTSNATSVLRAALGALRPLRSDPLFEQVEELQARGNSFYHGLTVSLERSAEVGRVHVAYTWSRLRDDGVVNTSSPLVAGDFLRERAASLLDARHRFVTSGVVTLPGRFWGVTLASTLNINSPRPFNIGIRGNDRNLDDVGTDRPNYIGSSDPIVWRRPGDVPDVGAHSRFSLPRIGEVGSLGRNAGRGPWQYTCNVRVSRVLEIRDKVKFTPQIEVYNPLNSAVFSFGAEYVDYSPGSEADFLVPKRTLKPRTMRIGLRIEF